jgi:hypothetical protein
VGALLEGKVVRPLRKQESKRQQIGWQNEYFELKFYFERSTNLKSLKQITGSSINYCDLLSSQFVSGVTGVDFSPRELRHWS